MQEVQGRPAAMDQPSGRWRAVVAGESQSRILQTEENPCFVCTAPELENYDRSGRQCCYAVST